MESLTNTAYEDVIKIETERFLRTRHVGLMGNSDVITGLNSYSRLIRGVTNSFLIRYDGVRYNRVLLHVDGRKIGTGGFIRNNG